MKLSEKQKARLVAACDEYCRKVFADAQLLMPRSLKYPDAIEATCHEDGNVASCAELSLPSHS